MSVDIKQSTYCCLLQRKWDHVVQMEAIMVRRRGGVKTAELEEKGF